MRLQGEIYGYQIPGPRSPVALHESGGLGRLLLPLDMDIVIDGEAKVQQARLYLKVTEENLKLRKALSQIQEEASVLLSISYLC